MTKRIALLFILLSTAAAVGRSQALDAAYGKPLVVLIEQNPWLMVIGSDTPTYVLYETGRAIYTRRVGNSTETYESSLSESELKEFIASLGISERFYQLPEQIEVSSWSDQPTNFLFIQLGSTSKRVYVYGDLRRTSREGDTRPPVEFLNIYEKLIGFKRPGEQKWRPNQMEVMLWDYSHARETQPWPKAFPDLNAKTTVKHGGGMYSIFLDRTQFDELKRFYSSLGERTAVQINGKKMSLSYRYPFPNL